MTGKSTPRKDGAPIWVQYPFEENLNITKNVSDFEVIDMCEKAKSSAKNLEKHLNQNMYFKDLGTALGLQQFKRPDSSKSKKNLKTIDVNELYNEPSKGAKNKAVKHRIL